MIKLKVTAMKFLKWKWQCLEVQLSVRMGNTTQSHLGDCLEKICSSLGEYIVSKKNLFNLRTLRLTKARRRTMRLGVWKHIVFDCVELSPNSKDAKQVIQRTCKTTVFEKQTSMKSCLWRFCDNQTLYQKQFASEFLSSCALTRLRLFVNPFLSNWKWVS